jgi:hypothetical protein
MLSRDAMLDEHLPYRMQQVDGLCWATRLILNGPSNGEIGVVFDGRWVVRSHPYRILTNPLVEAGLLHCRVLMNFLGLRLDKKTLRLAPFEKPSEKDDFSIVKLDLPAVTLAQIGQAPQEDPAHVLAACERTILSVNKGVAHFTDAATARSFANDANTCGETVLWLTEEFVYRKLGKPLPPYRVWSTAGTVGSAADPMCATAL